RRSLCAATLQPGETPVEGAGLTCAQTPAAPAALPAELADHARYPVVELLGVGGMGAAYKAEHRGMGRTGALKMINPGPTGKLPVVERFRREVKAAARLIHPNIVTAYDAEQAGDSHFLVMEFVGGRTLARLVHEQGPLPVAQACEFARQTAV